MERRSDRQKSVEITSSCVLRVEKQSTVLWWGKPLSGRCIVGRDDDHSARCGERQKVEGRRLWQRVEGARRLREAEDYGSQYERSLCWMESNLLRRHGNVKAYQRTLSCWKAPSREHSEHDYTLQPSTEIAYASRSGSRTKPAIASQHRLSMLPSATAASHLPRGS